MALVEFYISGFYQDGSLVNQENLFQTIPFEGGMPAILNPNVKASMGKAGSFDFGMHSTHPLYNALQQYKTKIRVVYAGTTIFQGRVITIDKTFDRTRTVHCEGMLSYLLDSDQEGTKEETRPEVTVLEYMQQVIDHHNQHVEDDKKFQLGEVPGNYHLTPVEQQVIIPKDKEKQQFGSTSWNTTMDRLEDLLDSFGGYFHIRHGEYDGVNYIDWVDKYYNANINQQPVEVASNLIDLSGTTELNNLFTAVIPIGKKGSENVYISDFWPVVRAGHAKVKHITVPELVTCGLYTDAELNANYHRKEDYANAISKYGWVWKTVNFENATTPEQLFGYVKDWIKNNFMAELTQWDVTALDLKIPGESNSPLLVGDRVPLRHPEVDQPFGSFTIIEAEYNLYNMEQSKYRIGIPNQQVNASYGVAQKNGGGKAGGGGSVKPPTKPDDLGVDIEQLKYELKSSYWAKTNYGEDITLDNPLAYFAYDRNGVQLTQDQVREKTKPYADIYAEATYYYRNDLTVRAVAEQLGLDPKDPHIRSKLIELRMEQRSPDYARDKRRQTENQMWYFQNELGFSLQEADLLVHDSTSSSTLAVLVNDDGSWSDRAIAMALPNAPNAASIKKMAIDARNILSGKKSTDAKTVLDQFRDHPLFAGITVGDLFDATTKITDEVDGLKEKAVNLLGGDINFNLQEFTDGAGKWMQEKFDLFGGLFSGDSSADEDGNPLAKYFKLSGDNAEIDGKSGKAFIGKDSSGNPKLSFNQPVTFIDHEGNPQTIGGDGQITAKDFNIPEVPSFRSKFAAFDQLWADQAEVNKITVNNEAKINNLVANAITTNNLQASIGKLDVINAHSIAATGSINGSSVSGSDLSGVRLYIGGSQASWQSKTVVTGLSFTKPSLGTSYVREFVVANGESNQRGRLVTSWDNGSYEVSSGTIYYLGHT